MYETVEVKGIELFSLLARFIEKRVFIMSCCILNFIRYFSSHSSIPLTIFTVISPNISSSDLDLVVSGGRGLSLRVDQQFYQQYFQSILPVTRFVELFFSWINIFSSTGRDILLEVLKYFLETTEVEKRVIQMYTNYIAQNLNFYWQPLYVSLQGNNSLVNWFYLFFASL